MPYKNSPSYSYQIRYNDIVVKFTDYADALCWCKDAAKEGIKNVAIEYIKPEKQKVS